MPPAQANTLLASLVRYDDAARLLTQRFGPSLRTKRLIVLGIAAEYTYMESRLVGLLKEEMLRHLGRSSRPSE
jgi:predicted protein tyrosine phosphatase